MNAPPKLVASSLLRAGLVFVFAYAGVTMLLAPEHYGHYLPSMIDRVLPKLLTLQVFGLYELLLVAGLLLRRHVAKAALASALTLVTIVVLNPDQFEVLFRNVAIAAAAGALFVEERAGTDVPTSSPSAARLEP